MHILKIIHRIVHQLCVTISVSYWVAAHVNKTLGSLKSFIGTKIRLKLYNIILSLLWAAMKYKYYRVVDVLGRYKIINKQTLIIE